MTIRASDPNGFSIKPLIAGIIIVYIPIRSSTKLPESPGSINAEIPKIPEKKTMAK